MPAAPRDSHVKEGHWGGTSQWLILHHQKVKFFITDCAHCEFSHPGCQFGIYKTSQWQQQLETRELYYIQLYYIHSTNRHATNSSDFSISAGYVCAFF